MQAFELLVGRDSVVNGSSVPGPYNRCTRSRPYRTGNATTVYSVSGVRAIGVLHIGIVCMSLLRAGRGEGLLVEAFGIDFVYCWSVAKKVSLARTVQ